MCNNGNNFGKILGKFYSSYDNLYNAIESFLKGESQDLSIKNLSITSCRSHDKKDKNIVLLPCHIDFAEVEPRITIAIERAQSKYDMPIYRKIPGVFRKLCSLIAKQYNIDYIFVDMSPSIGLLNRCLLMNSDYFIIPCAPDFFFITSAKFY